MRGEIIAIGDELTTGRIVNTTSAFAAGQLFAAGHEIIAITTIGDDIELIGATLQLALARAEFIVVTGGLGPTSDDLTNEAVASALDRPPTLYPEILRKIREYGRNSSQEVQLALEKLAWLPAGAHALHTEARTAGYFLVHQGKPIFFLPGVPHEMKALLVETVLTRLAVWEGEEQRTVRQKLYKVFGLAEAEINNRLAPLERFGPGVRLGYYPVFPEVQVSLTVTGEDRQRTETLFAELDQRIRELLGSELYGVGDTTMEAVVGGLLAERHQTLALAESCTGGGIGRAVTRVAGSSAYFLGGVVAYSNRLKERLLGVARDTLARHGAVSSQTALEMAAGVVRVSSADFGLSVTGIAGPGGGSPEKPVGTVYFGLASPAGRRSFHRLFSGDRWQIQALAVQTGLDLVRRCLLDSGDRAV